MRTATEQLFDKVESLSPTGEIGDGMVAQLQELARKARFDYVVEHGGTAKLKNGATITVEGSGHPPQSLLAIARDGPPDLPDLPDLPGGLAAMLERKSR